MDKINQGKKNKKKNTMKDIDNNLKKNLSYSNCLVTVTEKQEFRIHTVD